MSDLFLERLANENAATHATVLAYAEFHSARYDFLLQKARSLCPASNASVLDIGVSTFSLTLLDHYDDVSTLDRGLSIFERSGLMDKFASHIVYDLNASQASSPIPTDKTFDLIVLAEVIEHLHTAPELVLARLGSLLRPGGYLIIQTPNAAALYKRLYVLAGFNPFERISLSAEAPGHFREYTRRELIAIASQAGLEIVGHDYKDYFGVDAHHKYWLKLHGLLAMIVPSFARGQTLVARKPSS